MKKKQGSERSTSKLVAVRVPNSLHNMLFELAEEKQVSASQIIINALEEKFAPDHSQESVTSR